MVLGTAGHPPNATFGPAAVDTAWLTCSFLGDPVSCPHVILSIRSILSRAIVAFFFPLSSTVVFRYQCPVKVDSSEVRSTTEDSSRRTKGTPRSCPSSPEDVPVTCQQHRRVSWEGHAAIKYLEQNREKRVLVQPQLWTVWAAEMGHKE